MARYVLASRRAGKFHETEKLAARAQARAAVAFIRPDADIDRFTATADETAREVAVFEADPATVAAARLTAGPDVIIEEEILHFPAAVTKPLDARSPAAGPPAGSGQTLTLTVVGGGAPVAEARVVLVLRIGSFVTDVEGTTDGGGEVRFVFSPFFRPAVAIVTPPNFWATVFRSPPDRGVLEVPTPPKGPTYWWHEALGREEAAGAGIKCGVIDTGVGPNRDLRHVTNVGAFIDGLFDPDPQAGLDVDVHGTHVSGTIGARPTKTSRRPIGIAGDVDLFSARVFPPGRGANQGDIANAIDHLSRDRQVDLINLSLGSPQPSVIEQDAIRDALERGTLCICAAGNSQGPVEFPAGFPETVAVSALGLEGWGPPGTLASLRLPDDPALFGDDGLYLANFSCFGNEIDVGAPGVGIIATFPETGTDSAPVGTLDGTSMASPAALATLAAILSRNAGYQALPRDVTRARRARQLLVDSGRDIGLDRRFQGAGVPCDGVERRCGG